MSGGADEVEEHPNNGDQHHNGEHEKDIIVMQFYFVKSPATDQGTRQQHQVDSQQNREDTPPFLPDFLGAVSQDRRELMMAKRGELFRSQTILVVPVTGTHD